MGLFDSLVNAWSTDRSITKQNEANMAMAKYQTAVQEEMYNKYSSPSALMRQFKEAGLNPNLVYGNASSGQGNVPSFQAPHVERNLSGSEKLASVLSTLSQTAGVVQNIYQATAAKEAAEQSGIKTLRDATELAKLKGDLRLQNTLYGYQLYDSDYLSKFGKRVTRRIQDNTSIGRIYGSFFDNYSKIYRQSKLNELAKPIFSNVADYGLQYSPVGLLQSDQYFGVPFYRTRNAQNALKYRLTKELGNAGTWGKLALGLANVFF